MSKGLREEAGGRWGGGVEEGCGGGVVGAGAFRHFQSYKPLLKRWGPRGHVDRVPLPRGAKLKTLFIVVENASPSTFTHFTLIIAFPLHPEPLYPLSLFS